MKKEIITGNFFEKHKSKNPLIKLAMKDYYETLFYFMDEIVPIKSLISIGCANGYLLNKITEKYNCDSIGYDIDSKLIKKAKKKYQNITFEKKSIYNLKNSPKKYDVVLLLEILEHLEEPEKGLEIAKKLGKNVIVSVPNEPIWRIANICRGAYLKKLGNTPGHLNNWTKNQFKNIINKYFNNVKYKTSAFLWNFALCKNE